MEEETSSEQKADAPAPDKGGRPIWAIAAILVLLAILAVASLGIAYLFVNSDFSHIFRGYNYQRGYERGQSAAAIQSAVEEFYNVENRFPREIGELIARYPDIKESVDNLGEEGFSYSLDEERGYVLRFSGFDEILGTNDDVFLDHIQYNEYMQAPFKAQSIPYHYLLFGRLYEFHPSYIQAVDFGSVSNNYPVTTIKVTSGSLYSYKDIYDVEHSSNIRAVENDTEKQNWRGITYDRVNFYLYPESVLDEEPFFFVFKYKMDRLPHLHTQEKITANRELHWGVSTGPTQLKIDRKYLILAFPKSSEIIEVFQHPPTKIGETGEWRLYIYDESNLEGRIAAHIKFNLSSEDVGSVELNEVLEMLPAEQAEDD